MAIKEVAAENITEPLMRKEKNLAGEDGGGGERTNSKGNPWMVYFSTLIAVCGSYAFGSCVSFIFLLLRIVLETRKFKTNS